MELHLTVIGDHNVVNTGATSDTLLEVQGERWESLKRELLRLGLPEAELRYLQVAVESDSTLALPPKAMGPATGEWLREVVDRVGAGTLHLGSEVAAAAIATELLKFISVG